MPTFSVLVPVYNHEEFVGEALDSLLAQTDPDWEALVVDDGSTDGSGDVLRRYAACDARIRVHRQQNGGQARALNAALARATGDWICWLSSDDLFSRDKLSVHRSHILRNTTCKFFFSDVAVLDDESGEIASDETWSSVPDDPRLFAIDLLSRNFINGIGTCIHKSVFANVGTFADDFRYAQDYDLYIRILSKYQGAFISHQTCTMRCHKNQYTRRKRQEMFLQCAEAGMRFLNTHCFEDFFPCVDLRRVEVAHACVHRALDLAMNRYAYLYAGGIHPLLVSRIIEWLFNKCSKPIRCALLRNILDRVWMAAEWRDDWGMGDLWRAVAMVLCCRGQGRYECKPIPLDWWQESVAKRKSWISVGEQSHAPEIERASVGRSDRLTTAARHQVIVMRCLPDTRRGRPLFRPEELCVELTKSVNPLLLLIDGAPSLSAGPAGLTVTGAWRSIGWWKGVSLVKPSVIVSLRLRLCEIPLFRLGVNPNVVSVDKVCERVGAAVNRKHTVSQLCYRSINTCVRLARRIRIME